VRWVMLDVSLVFGYIDGLVGQENEAKEREE